MRVWRVLCLLLGARRQTQCLFGSGGRSAEVWIDYPATEECNCGLTGEDYHIRLWCQHWSVNLGFHLEQTCLTSGVSQGNPHRRRVGRSWYTGSARRGRQYHWKTNGADTGSACLADMGSDPPVASTCGLTNVLSRKILSGSISSSGLRVLDIV